MEQNSQQDAQQQPENGSEDPQGTSTPAQAPEAAESENGLQGLGDD